MRIGALIGKTDKGDLRYLGAPGDIDSLRKLQREIVDKGGELQIGTGKGKTGAPKKVRFVKTWLDDVTSRPLRTAKS